MNKVPILVKQNVQAKEVYTQLIEQIRIYALLMLFK